MISSTRDTLFSETDTRIEIYLKIFDVGKLHSDELSTFLKLFAISLTS